MRFKYLKLGIHDFSPLVKPIVGANAIRMVYYVYNLQILFYPYFLGLSRPVASAAINVSIFILLYFIVYAFLFYCQGFKLFSIQNCSYVEFDIFLCVFYFESFKLSITVSSEVKYCILYFIADYAQFF